MRNQRTNFSPSEFLAAPRRSGITPNAAGTHALYNLSTYSFENHSNETGVHVIDLESHRSWKLTQDTQLKEHTWTGFGSDVLSLKRVDDDSTEFWVEDVASLGQKLYRAGQVNSAISILKITRLTENAFAVIALGSKTVKGTVSHSTGKEYSALPVRNFSGEPPAKKVIWYIRFELEPSRPESQFSLSWKIGDILKDTGLEFVPHSGAMPFGPKNLDASTFGLTFVAKKQGLPSYQNPTWTSDVYFVPTSQLQSPEHVSLIRPTKLTVERFSGMASLPVFSCKGSIAFLKNEDETKVTSNNHIFLSMMGAKNDPIEVILNASVEEQDPWLLSPDMLMWSTDERTLFISATDTGRQKFFQIPISVSGTSGNQIAIPTALDIGDGSISDFYPYSYSTSDHRLLVSKSSLTDSSTFLIVDPSTNSSKLLSTLTDCESFGLKRDQISEFWFQGHGNYQVHSWIVRPSYFKENSKYPLALFIHGGPPASWLDNWSTRWNPVIFAEQGYVVVCPDVTGSTGYNADFQEAAIGNLAGRPYKDLEHCFEHVEKHISYADTTNAVALGGSYGGYLIYWLAGQPFARKFKALVAHAGMYNTTSLYSSDVPDLWKVYFDGYDRDPAEILKIFKKWDPAQFAHLWQTPILITHNELDTRCPQSMGIAAFTAAQMRGVESKFLAFEDEGHFVLKPENSLHWHRVVVEWINKYTCVEGG